MFGGTTLKTFALPGITLGIAGAAGLIYYQNVEKVTWLRVRRQNPAGTITPTPERREKAEKTAQKVTNTYQKTPLPKPPKKQQPQSLPLFKQPKPPKKRRIRSAPVHKYDPPPLGYKNDFHKKIDPFAVKLPELSSPQVFVQPPMA